MGTALPQIGRCWSRGMGRDRSGLDAAFALVRTAVDHQEHCSHFIGPVKTATTLCESQCTSKRFKRKRTYTAPPNHRPSRKNI
eukprot:1798123-Rhodomonas_salina.2